MPYVTKKTHTGLIFGIQVTGEGAFVTGVFTQLLRHIIPSSIQQ